LTSTVNYNMRLTHTTSGTPAAGIGIGLEFEQETSGGNNEILGILECIATDVTAASEDGKFVWKLSRDGAVAAEVMSLTSDGSLTVASNLTVIAEIDVQGGGLISTTSGFDISAASGQDVTVTPMGGGDFIVNTNLIFADTSQSNVGIGTTSVAASAILELSSTTGALLLTRLTTVQRNALTPVNGMIIYNSDTNQIEAYRNAWIAI
jgi:hypothetical protein